MDAVDVNVDEGEKKAENKETPILEFPETLKPLEEVLQFLLCSKCGELPAKHVYTLGNCFHKYCEPCVEQVCGKACLVCTIVSNKEYMMIDTFSTGLLTSLRKVKKVIKKESPPISNSNENPMEVDVDTKNNKVDEIPVLPVSSSESNAADNGILERQDEEKNLKDDDFVHGPPHLTPNFKSRPTSYSLLGCTSSRKAGSPSKKMAAEKENDGDIFDFVDEVNAMDTTFDTSPPTLTPYGKPTTRKSNGKEDNDTPANIRKSTRSRAATTAPMDQTLKKKLLTVDKSDAMSPLNVANIKVVAASTPKSDDLSPIGRRGRSESQASSAGSASPASVSFTSSTNVDKRNSKGETPLHVACRTGQLEKARHLIIAGADPNAQDYAGWTPLHEAINGKGSPTCKLDLVKLLCEQGACNPNIPGMDNETAVHEAARGALLEIVAYLLDHDASPNIRNRAGKLPRDVAANSEIAKIFEDAASKSSGINNLDISNEDPIVLEIQLANAVLFFNKAISPDVISQVQKILKLKVSKEFGGDVTHVIFPCESEPDEKKVDFSLQYLQAISKGVWILSLEWIDKSIAAMRVQSPGDFEINKCFGLELEIDAPRRARINKEHGNPGLLHGFCIYIYKSSATEKISKKDMMALVRSADGEIINREPNPTLVDPFEYPIRFHAKTDNHKLTLTSHIILYDDKNKPPASKMYNMEHIKVLKTQWLIDSLASFQLQDPDNYLF